MTAIGPREAINLQRRHTRRRDASRDRRASRHRSCGQEAPRAFAQASVDVDAYISA